jgi:hypothetical protein
MHGEYVSSGTPAIRNGHTENNLGAGHFEVIELGSRAGAVRENSGGAAGGCGGRAGRG